MTAAHPRWRVGSRQCPVGVTLSIYRYLVSLAFFWLSWANKCPVLHVCMLGIYYLTSIYATGSVSNVELPESFSVCLAFYNIQAMSLNLDTIFHRNDNFTVAWKS